MATRKIKSIIHVYLESCSHVWVAVYFCNSASEQSCESFQELVLTSLPPQFLLPTLIFPFFFFYILYSFKKGLHFIFFQPAYFYY